MATLTSSEIRSQLLAFFTESFPLFNPDLSDTVPMSEHGIDSLGTTEIVLYLERHFQIQIADSDLTRSNLGSLQAIVDFVEHKLQG